jgi:hypothetical protein
VALERIYAGFERLPRLGGNPDVTMTASKTLLPRFADTGASVRESS